MTAPADALRRFIYQQFPLAKSRELADDDSLIEGGLIDSLGILELVTFIESEFAIVLEDDEVGAENFDSIKSLAEFLQHKLASTAAVSTSE